jgi:hypothetical protein
VVGLFSVGCGSDTRPLPEPPDTPPPLARETAVGVVIPSVRFTDITARAGIRFQHTNGSFGKKLLPETMGGGVAFIDFDRDGRQDLLLINSCNWPGHEGMTRPTLKLYRNKGDGTFEDVTEAVGLAVTMYGMGVTVGDYDNDGWPDIFISGVGGNRLFHNVGGKRFEDVTQTAGVAGPGPWPTASDGDFLTVARPIGFPSSAAFLDYDGDGRLDLFVCYYVSWSPAFDLAQPFPLKGGKGQRGYGPPNAFEGTQCILYHNLGNGRFEDVSAKAGIQVFEPEGIGPDARPRPVCKGLGVIVCDVDQDGWPDIIVANDTVRNLFFHNRGDGTFEEIGQFAGVAYAEGRARGAMGIDYGEYRPGRYALILANFADEPDTFLRRDDTDRLSFRDVALAEGLFGPSRKLLKFGAFFFDYDLDGRLDLLTCNGHLEPEISTVQRGQSYEQPAQLFWNCGGKSTYVEVTEKEAGPDLFQKLVGRGCAYADIDGDGYPDLVLVGNGGPARLLHNDGPKVGPRNHWIRLQLEGDGVRSNRSAIGAQITLEAGEWVQHRQVTSGRGYLSQSELPVTFGLGQTSKVDRITIRWPGAHGGTQELTGLAIDQTHVIQQRK